jgi:hypothetical protein
MQIDTTEKFIKALEDAITEIGRQNGKVLAAQIKTLIDMTKTGASEQTILVWEYHDTPYALKTLVDETYPQKADHVVYVVAYPIGYRGEWLHLHDRNGKSIYPHLVKLPLQTLHAFF